MGRGSSKAGKSGGGGYMPPKNAINEEDYIADKGYPLMSGVAIDKVGGANQFYLSEKQRRKALESIRKDIDAYYEKREQLRKEYRKKVKEGTLRPLTSLENTLLKAQGNPDNQSTQAARRMAEKRGYDWKTGKKLKKK